MKSVSILGIHTSTHHFLWRPGSHVASLKTSNRCTGEVGIESSRDTLVISIIRGHHLFMLYVAGVARVNIFTYMFSLQSFSFLVLHRGMVCFLQVMAKEITELGDDNDTSALQNYLLCWIHSCDGWTWHRSRQKRVCRCVKQTLQITTRFKTCFLTLV